MKHAKAALIEIEKTPDNFTKGGKTVPQMKRSGAWDQVKTALCSFTAFPLIPGMYIN
jgi:hypothetical protein